MNTMTQDQPVFKDTRIEARVKKLDEENLMLFNQLHVVQEELERLYHERVNPSTLKLSEGGGGKLTWVDDQLPEVMAENVRCRTTLETQKEVYRVECQHSLSRELGDILIQGITSSAALLTVPSKLLRVWRKERMRTPPNELGGKGFDTIIAAYRNGGLAAVESLLVSVPLSATMHANALTTLARSLMHKEPTNSAEIARRAYAADPRPFRLKWLAFRLHEAGELLEAESMLEVLPSDMKFSGSEALQADRLRSEAKQVRLRNAKQICRYSERRTEVERLVSALTHARDEQAKLAVKQRGEIEALQQARAQLEQENMVQLAKGEALQAEVATLTHARDEQAMLAVQQRGEIEALQQARAQLEQENMVQLARGEALQAEVATLTHARDEQAMLAVHQRGEIEALQQARAQLEQENSALIARHKALQAEVDALNQAWDEEAALAAQRQNDIEVLQAEIAALLQARDEQAALAVLRKGECETLQQVQAQLEQKTLALMAQHEAVQAEVAAVTQARDEQVALAVQREGDVETLQQIKAQLEQENAALVARAEALQEEAVALAAQRQSELLQVNGTLAALEKERSGQNLRVRELERQLEQVVRACDEQSKLATEQIPDLTAKLDQRNGVVDQQLKKQSEDLIRMQKSLAGFIKKEITNSTKQTQALIGLQSYYSTGDLPTLNIEHHTWPVNPEFALYMVQLIELNAYDIIIEFGSGISTVVVAKALAKIALRQHGKQAKCFTSFDHLEKYYQQTSSHLEQAGLGDAVQLVLAPLQDWQAPNGKTYSYYSCQGTLASLAQKYATAGLRVLAIVDGPPADTGKHARYPAGPLLLQHFPEAHIDILLDDHIRLDEKEVAQLWQAEIQAAGLMRRVTESKLEKDACLISVYSHNNKGSA